MQFSAGSGEVATAQFGCNFAEWVLSLYRSRFQPRRQASICLVGFSP